MMISNLYEWEMVGWHKLENCLAFGFRVYIYIYIPRSSKGVKFHHQKQTQGLNFDTLGGSRFIYIYCIYIYIHVYTHVEATSFLHSSTPPTVIRANQNAGTPSFPLAAAEKDDPQKSRVCRWVFGPQAHRFTPKEKTKDAGC